MTQVTALSILALTVSLALRRPRIFRARIDHATAALLGAFLCLVTGIVPLELAGRSLEFLVIPVVTIVSLMVITLVAEQAGLFAWLAHRIAIAAGGRPQRLFAYLFFTGTVTGSIFTNDAAVLIFTPLVLRLVEQVQDESWSHERKLPFYFAVLYVANIVGMFVISNPINIIVSKFFGISFLTYACWMVLPALVSIIVTYYGLKVAFRHSLPETYRLPPPMPIDRRRRTEILTCAVMLLATLVAFFSEELTGIPTWAVAAGAAATLVIVHRCCFGGSTTGVVRGVGWDVIIFVVGIFLVDRGLWNVGVTTHLGDWLTAVSGGDLFGLTTSTSLTAGVVSAVVNNHPTAGTMAMTIADMNLPAAHEKVVVFAALIGGGLGPKMLPTGSLAALMWFRILRSRGVPVSYWQYVKLGVPITLLAIVLSVLTLSAEMWLVTWMQR